MPRWKQVCIIVGALLLVVAAVLWFVEPRGGTATSGAASSGGATAQSLLPEGGGRDTSGTRTGPSASGGDEAWSAGFFKMGFSFFVGLAIGTALRVFLKVALIACGLAFLLLFWLGSIELITVNWQAMDVWFDDLGHRLGAQFESLKALLTGSLPAAGLGTLGLYAGLRRR